MTDTERNKKVAKTIWNQITFWTKAACGAREACTVDNGLRFKAARNLYVTVTLNDADTYDVECYRLKRGTYDKIVLENHVDVYVESLNDVVYHTVNK